MTLLQEMHDIANERFKNEPSKCYQRHIREVWAEHEKKEPIISLKGAIVKQISRDEAKEIILKYEWLAADPRVKGPMGYGIKAYYGLFLNGELLGANCLGHVAGQIGNICGTDYKDKTIALVRGACVPHAPKNAASFFITYTCKQAYKDFGWEIFIAYSDGQAGEVGTVYQASHWYYLGVGVGRGKEDGKGVHYNYISPDGSRRVTSYQLNHDKERKFLKSLGWTDERSPDGKYIYPMREFLRDSAGWKQEKDMDKHKWVWFEGTKENKTKLLNLAKTFRGYEPRPYPKRAIENELA